MVAEIESVNVEALRELKAQGKKVIPDPDALEIISDKARQREFFNEKGLPGPAFEVLDAADIKARDKACVQKLRKGGYDGKGVQVLAAGDEPIKEDSLFEELVEIEKEISVVACRDAEGNFANFDPVEMVFKEGANLLDYMICPAGLDDGLMFQCIELAKKVGEAMNYEGVYAVEIFLTKDHKLLLNEVSPRVHNSGHHTVHSYNASQYDQVVRIALGLPMAELQKFGNAVLLNLVAEEDAQGPAVYNGLERCLAAENVHFTFYNKPMAKPYRKMGHAVVVEDDLEKAMKSINLIKSTLTITGDGK